MKILVTSVIAWFLAQFIKCISESVHKKKVCLYSFFASGGMPSSHTALVTSLTIQIGLIYGIQSTYFAISSVFSVIIMYDAAGVRRAVGIQAKKINELLEDGKQDNDVSNDALKEILGHTPLEVIMGLLLGSFIAIVSYFLF